MKNIYWGPLSTSGSCHTQTGHPSDRKLHDFVILRFSTWNLGELGRRRAVISSLMIRQKAKLVVVEVEKRLWLSGFTWHLIVSQVTQVVIKFMFFGGELAVIVSYNSLFIFLLESIWKHRQAGIEVKVFMMRIWHMRRASFLKIWLRVIVSFESYRNWRWSYWNDYKERQTTFVVCVTNKDIYTCINQLIESLGERGDGVTSRIVELAQSSKELLQVKFGACSKKYRCCEILDYTIKTKTERL